MNIHPLTMVPEKRVVSGSRGEIIAVEGIDGSGKTTLTKALQRALADRGEKSSIFVNFSGNTPYWNTVMGIKHSLEKEDNPIDPAADQTLHVMEFMTYVTHHLPRLLADNDYVLADRYVLGKIVLAQMDTQVKNSEPERILKHCLEKELIPSPMLTIFLDLDPALAYNRILDRGQSLERKESLCLLHKARFSFEEIYDTFRDQFKIARLDCTVPVEYLVQQSLNLILP